MLQDDELPLTVTQRTRIGAVTLDGRDILRTPGLASSAAQTRDHSSKYSLVSSAQQTRKIPSVFGVASSSRQTGNGSSTYNLTSSVQQTRDHFSKYSSVPSAIRTCQSTVARSKQSGILGYTGIQDGSSSVIESMLKLSLETSELGTPQRDERSNSRAAEEARSTDNPINYISSGPKSWRDIKGAGILCARGDGHGRGRGNGRGRGDGRGRGNGRGFGDGRGRGGGRGGDFGKWDNKGAKQMECDDLDQLEEGDPAQIVMILSSPNSGFRSSLTSSDDGIITRLIKVLDRAGAATGKRSTLIHLYQQVISSDFLLGPVTIYLSSLLMSCTVDLNSIYALCRLLLAIIEAIPATAADRVTPLLAQLHSINTIMKTKDKMLDDLLTNIKEAQDIVIQQIRSGHMVKETKRNMDEDDIEPPDDFRRMPVFPVSDDLRCDVEPFLRKNKISGSYRDVDHYLDVQFRLLREDYVMPLRQGIRELRRADGGKLDDKYMQDVRIYDHVTFAGSWYNENGIVIRIQFDVSPLKRVKWEVSKRLIYGSLVCLSADTFDTFTIGTVIDRDPKLLKNGIIDILLMESVKIDYLKNYMMVESSAYFEAYRHNLEGLQELSEDSLPFKEYLLNVKSTDADAPRYLRGREARYDFTPILKTKATNLMRPPMRAVLSKESWPTAAELGLDDSQYRAVQRAVTNEMAIIQGPPGTGKTFIGLRITHLLLHNYGVWGRQRQNDGPDIVNRPILLVCYTNHALDQFLEGVLQFGMEHDDADIIRVGGRSSSDNPELKKCNLAELRRNPDVRIPRESRDTYVAIIEQMKTLEQSLANISQKLGNVKLYVLTFNDIMNMMTDVHRKFFESMNTQTRVRDWLMQGRSFGTEEHSELWDDLEAAGGFEATENFGVDANKESNRTCNAYDMAAFEEEMVLLEQERRIYNDYEESGNTRLGETSRKMLDEGFLEVSGKKKGRGKKDNVLEWQTVGPNKRESKIIKHELAMDDFITPEEEGNIGNIWQLSPQMRWRLYRLWRKRYIDDILARLVNGNEEYSQLAHRLKEAKQEEDYHILRQAKVIAMTTSGAARLRHILRRVGPRIVIVEEAAEVLEAHIITSLSPECEHLILIGDHQQLRPNPTVYKLAKKYNLDISLFERMLVSGMNCECLQTQHRMRPEIVKLIVPHVYKSLRNAESVLTYENIQGINGNMFFVQHQHAEKNTYDTRSRTNTHEALYVKSLCRYLFLQGYEPQQITILTTYTGQMFEIKRDIRKDYDISSVRVTPVDNYQGEENDIILLSLVRSNDEGNIGFLKTANRICVALSRARKGLYVIGDMKLMRESSLIWSNILDDPDISNKVVDGLPLFCQNHPDSGVIAVNPDDFLKAPDGGCQRLCESRLQCGHACVLKCHPRDPEHIVYKCKKPCIKITCPIKHPCPKKCFEDCGDCVVKVAKTMPRCGHVQNISCHIPPEKFECTEPCKQRLVCGHLCPNTCGSACISVVMCSVVVEGRTWPCDHVLDVECSKTSQNYPCPVEVEKLLSCGHEAKMKCSDDPINYTCQNIITLKLCTEGCLNNVPCSYADDVSKMGCQVNKEKVCSRNPQHKFKARCCEYETAPCTYQCAEMLDCHHPCSGVCGVCHRDKKHAVCRAPCRRKLPCQHPCPGRCGEPCQPCPVRQCATGCPHGQCRKPCNDECFRCPERCLWQCRHHACRGICSEACTRDPCDLKCDRRLPCGHPCPGYCGEPCPVICRVCQPDYYIQIQSRFGPTARTHSYVLLMPCYHVLPRNVLDHHARDYMERNHAWPRRLTIFNCPMCSQLIQYAPRYSAAIHESRIAREKIKKAIFERTAIWKKLSNTKVGKEILEQIRSGKVSRNTSERMRIRQCIGCLALLAETSDAIDKARNSKEHTKESLANLTSAKTTFQASIERLVKDDLYLNTETSKMIWEIKFLWMRSILTHMLTYIKSFQKRNIINGVIADLMRPRATLHRLMMETANRTIVSNITVHLRNGINSYVETSDKYFQIQIEALSDPDMYWTECQKGHTYGTPMHVALLDSRCTICDYDRQDKNMEFMADLPMQRDEDSD